MAEQQKTGVILPYGLANDIMLYLGERPYKEVAHLVQAVKDTAISCDYPKNTVPVKQDDEEEEDEGFGLTD